MTESEGDDVSTGTTSAEGTTNRGSTAEGTTAGGSTAADWSTAESAPAPLETATDSRVRAVDTGRGRVAYAEYGDPDGDPVLFFHGTPGSRLLGAVYADAASERGVRVLAVDRPGYGESDPWRDRTLADTGEFAVPVIDDAGVDRAGVVGFSGGGPHALAMAALHPGRVRRVDLVGGAVPPDCGPDGPRAQRLLATLAARTPRLLGGLLRFQTWLARRNPSAVVDQYTTGDTGDVPAEVTALAGRDFVEALDASRNGVVTESRLLESEWDVSLEAVDAPVTLWHGDRDGNVPIEGARQFQRRLPDADLTVFETDHLRSLLASRPAVLEGQATVETE
jgi:pimeloyl-ACP methyl ester carboxylesterase